MSINIPKNTKNIKKIKIKKINLDIVRQKGLFDEGCYESACNDICCEYGCDVDLASLKLIYKHRKQIEPLIKAKIEDCFQSGLKADDDYIGGGWRETEVREKDQRCMFHLHKESGCSLFYLVGKKGLPEQLIPTICKTYPITWNRGDLFVDRPLRQICKCREIIPKDRWIPSLYETQKKYLKRVFDIPAKEIEKVEKALKKEKALAAPRIKAVKEKIKRAAARAAVTTAKKKATPIRPKKKSASKAKARKRA